MPRKKLQINATEEQIDKLVKSLKLGSPLNIALQFAGISATNYYYWVAMYSVVLEIKSQEELEELKAIEFGVSIEEIKDIALNSAPTKKTAMAAYIEPSAESLLQYKKQPQFRKFANECYEIIQKCNEARAGAALNHLNSITKSVTDKRVNASGSMWFLERTFSEFFSKPNEKTKEEEGKKLPVEGIKVEFVDPGTKDSKQRIREMEERILQEQKGIGES